MHGRDRKLTSVAGGGSKTAVYAHLSLAAKGWLAPDKGAETVAAARFGDRVWGRLGWTALYSAGLGEEAGELDVDEVEGGGGVVQAGAEELGVLGGCGLQGGEPLVQGQDGGLAGRAVLLGGGDVAA